MSDRRKTREPEDGRRFRVAGSSVVHAMGITMLGLLTLASCQSQKVAATDPLTDAGSSTTPEPDAGTSSEDAGAGDCERDRDGVPPDLGCTGLYADWSSKTVAQSVRAYRPGLTFFSDGAEKARWIRLPEGAVIDSADMSEWVFPVGTKVWKEFKVSGIRVETRYLEKVGDGEWVMATYRWEKDESAARRITGGEQDVHGTGYSIPSDFSCVNCHNGSKDSVLGFEAFALGLPTAEGFDLKTLAEEGRLSAPPSYAYTNVPEDRTGKAAAALGWLHVNCGLSCHNPEGRAGASFTGLYMKLSFADGVTDGDAGTGDAGSGTDGGVVSNARVRATNTWKTAARIKPQSQHYAEAGYLRIAPGDSAKSLITTLAGSPRTQAGAMPPIGPRTLDDAGVGSVRAWIDALGADGGL